MRDFFYGPFIGGRAAAGLFLLRLVAGSALILHGWPKVQNAMSWMPPQSPVPGWLQALAAAAEFGGGIALILGLLTTVAAFGVGCVMIGALALVHMPQGHPFVASGGPSMELAALYLAAACMFMLAGPGTWSLDALMLDRGRVAIDEHVPAHIHLDRAA